MYNGREAVPSFLCPLVILVLGGITHDTFALTQERDSAGFLAAGNDDTFEPLYPVVYELRLELDSQSHDVDGQVRIHVQCRRNSTRRIRLHANPSHIHIQLALLESALTNESIVLPTPLVDWQRETVEFNLKSPLEEAHVYYLALWFRTTYASDGKGLTRNSGPASGMWINTLFEPTYARRLFPASGVDEPKWRAVMQLELRCRNELAADDYVALSNTNSTMQRLDGNTTEWRFEATPPIPTYLFTIAVGRFESVCSQLSPERKQVCIWRFAHLDGWKDMALTIATVAEKFHQGMADYLLSDPVARLYFLFVPFSYNGMENFGLVNIKELLWPLEGDDAGFQRFCRTLYHEISHQWFGNLVTIDAWEHIWLAEAFATFFAAGRPVYSPTNDLTTDALISFNWTNNRIPLITYTKGAAIVEMLASILGEQHFRKFLRDYVRVYEFKSTNTRQLLGLLNTSLPSDARELATQAVEFLVTWLYRGSYPIVFVDYDAVRQQFRLSQTPKVSSASNADGGWAIPVWSECLEGTVAEKLHWIPPSRGLMLNLAELTHTNDSTQVSFNRNRSVYYQLSHRH